MSVTDYWVNIELGGKRCLLALTVAALAWPQTRPLVEQLRVLTGNSPTTVTRALRDGKGNVIAAGVTFASDLATTSSVFDDSFAGGSNLRRIAWPDNAATNLTPLPDVTVDEVITDPVRPETLYVTTRTRVFRSSDAGRTWAVISPAPSVGVTVTTQLTVSRTMPGVLYLRLQVRQGTRSLVETLYSDDDTTTWQRISVLPFEESKRLLFIHPEDPCRLFGESYDGTYSQSDDCARSWRPISLPPATLVNPFLDPRPPYRLYGYPISGATILRSDDFGETWNVLTTPFPFTIAADPLVPGGLIGWDDNGKLYRSSDGGATWTQAPATLPPVGALYDRRVGIEPDFTTGSVFFGATFTVTPSAPARLRDVIFVSTDGLATIRPVFELLTPLGSTAWSFSAGPGGLFFHSERSCDLFIGKWNSQGELLWLTYLGGDDEEAVSALAVDDSGDVYIAGSTESQDFPFTHSLGGGDEGKSFLAKLSSDGKSLVFAARLPWTVSDLQSGANSSIYLSGDAARGLPSPFPPQRVRATGTAGFAGRLSPDARSLEWATYLGAEGGHATTIQVDAAGNSYVGLNGGAAKLDPDGRLVWRTLLGDMRPLASHLHSDGHLFIGGMTCTYFDPPTQDYRTNVTLSPWAFQSTMPPFQVIIPPRSTFDCNDRDGILARIEPSAGGVVYSTLLAGAARDNIRTVTADADGNAIVTGVTYGLADPLGVPTRSPLATMPGIGSSFLAKFNHVASDVFFSTYVPGFTPAAVLPHPEEGFWLVGTAADPSAEIPVEGIALLRLTEMEKAVPRIDGALGGGFPSILRRGEPAVIEGEGFEPGARLRFGDRVLDPLELSARRMVVIAPADLPPGAYSAVLESGGRLSPPVTIRIF